MPHPHRRPPQHRGRALSDEPARAMHADAIAHGLHLGEQVARDEHRRAAVGQPAQELTDLAHPGGIQAVRRLVEHQELGLAEQRQPDAETLAHPLAVRLDALVGRVREPDDRETLVDARQTSRACRRRRPPARAKYSRFRRPERYR